MAAAGVVTYGFSGRHSGTVMLSLAAGVAEEPLHEVWLTEGGIPAAVATAGVFLVFHAGTDFL